MCLVFKTTIPNSCVDDRHAIDVILFMIASLTAERRVPSDLRSGFELQAGYGTFIV